MTYIFLNNQVPPLNNLDVRKAINYAINRTEILTQWGGPLAGSPSDQIIPPGQSDYKQYTIYPNTPNLTMAKKLMQESGVKTPITLVLRTQNDTPGFMHMAEVIQTNLKAIGINVQIVGTPNSVNSSYISTTRPRPDGDRAVVADFPDGEAIINTGLDPADSERAGEHGPVRRCVVHRPVQQRRSHCKARHGNRPTRSWTSRSCPSRRRTPRCSTPSGTTSCRPGWADTSTARRWTPSTTTRCTSSNQSSATSRLTVVTVKEAR